MMHRYKAYVHFVLLAAGPVAASVLLSPHVFNGLLWLGRHVEALAFLRDTVFSQLAVRLALFTMMGVALAYGARTGLLKSMVRADGAHRGRSFFVAFAAGALSLAALDGLALASGAYAWQPANAGDAAVKTLTGLAAAAVIGLLEEGFYRGILLGVLLRGGRVLVSVLVLSVFFALIHFVRPMPVDGIVFGHVDSGWQLLRHGFGEFALGAGRVMPMMLTLFLMSLALCFVRLRSGHIFAAAGLHAGWVWVIQMHDEWLIATDRAGVLWKTPATVAESWAAAVMMASVLGLIILNRGKAE